MPHLQKYTWCICIYENINIKGWDRASTTTTSLVQEGLDCLDFLINYCCVHVLLHNSTTWKALGSYMLTSETSSLSFLYSLL